ncbi:hypothetical protein [uncultured Actinobacillus sp.]|uniref:hypothetical protein n=1 Tax=uncultured Actinobacillus sp. TaxID=417616 RepID=UPI0026001813|nr:hypothetical protein [uncultured Actinobacillus sp.]
MKQKILISLFSILTACTTPQNQPKAPLDMQAVQEYNAKVYSGNTVPLAERMKSPKQVDTPVNQSDQQSRKSPVMRVNPNIAVGVGYGRGYCHHRYCW